MGYSKFDIAGKNGTPDPKSGFVPGFPLGFSGGSRNIRRESGILLMMPPEKLMVHGMLTMRLDYEWGIQNAHDATYEQNLLWEI